ncbi:MAG: LON peptidase substrate-binding domain-containing protein, partial [Granulosicoccaceae bacterium]
MSTEVVELPLFPLGTVLFPAGELSLRIFEPRYVDMVSRCGREQTGFVVVAIKDGHEVGQPATPYAVGTEVQIVDWDSESNGLLLLLCKGLSKVSIARSWLQDDGLLVGEVQRHAPEPEVPVAAESQY